LEKKKQTRKNRYKKDQCQARQRTVSRFVVGLKLIALIAVIMGFSALFMVGYAAVTTTDYFRTEAIKVSGLSRLTETAVLTQAKIHKGDNLLAVNLGLVRKRLLAHPWIATARVAREIPGTICIEITEHQALAVLDLGRKFLINTNGRVFKENGPDDPQALPRVTGIAYADMSLGEDALSPAMTAVVQVLQISQARTSAIAYTQIREVHMDPEMGIALTVWQDQRRIKLGFAPFESKYQRIKQLLPYLRHSSKWQGFDTIDANNPDRIVVQVELSHQKGA
jgi:cell division protein FtsQ